MNTEKLADIHLKPLKFKDYPSVKLIYEQGIQTNNATFETTAPEWEEWNRSHLEACRLIALSNAKVVGWVALSPVSNRCVYGVVAEVSIYVDTTLLGLGIGRLLLHKLIQESETFGIWTLQAGLFPENTASLKLHLSAGFYIVGKREKIGMHQGIWRDTLLLERRSHKTGI
jgi:phosphinothricin acetyltransferase